MFIGRIVDLTTDRCYLHVDRGFMVVDREGQEVGRIPLDDIAAILAHANGLIYTNNLLVELARREAALVVCGANHLPEAILWPVESHHRQSARMDAQLAASKPLKKRLWMAIVKAKLTQQAAVLGALELPHAPLTALIGKVRSGDPDNIEAQGARRYWRMAFGEEFRRDRTAEGANALLNYGYTVLRAATARAVFAAGLHPGIGLGHRQGGNAMRLVDDLMEPFRPMVDLVVLGLLRQGISEVGPKSKPALAKLMYRDLSTRAGSTPVMSALCYLATSLGKIFEQEQADLALPEVIPSEDLRMLIEASGI